MKDSNKTGKLIKMLLIWALLICATAVVYLRQQSGQERPVARITVNGTVVNEIDLTSSALPKTFTYEGAGGFTNTIEAEEGRIRVSEAGCPDQICVHQGWISDGTVPIVCLPNKLVIEIKGGGDGLDAATG